MHHAHAHIHQLSQSHYELSEQVVGFAASPHAMPNAGFFRRALPTTPLILAAAFTGLGLAAFTPITNFAV